MRYFGLGAFSAFLLATSALAGEEVLYEPVPDWVDEAEVEPGDRNARSPILLVDQQARIESGKLWTYSDMAAALDSPEALTQLGTLSASWLPDKGDLRIHRAELIRDGETINLLADGGEFEVLRRERRLENRMLSGQLTATMPVTGARLGDIVRMAYSTTVSDQALGQHVQWQSGLIAKPFPLDNGRVQVSWPSNLNVSFVRRGDAEIAPPSEQGGMTVWSVELPVEEPEEWPNDSPVRYQLGELMQVSTYDSWRAVSSNMSAHYDVSQAIAAGGALATEIDKIAAQSDDKLTRAALAVRLVQDQISYLLNGLNGGNYLPQSPEETWANRFGDCKAKSVLLLAMLRELGIESEVVLVRSTGGDALPLLAPMPANFDHMIVRAQIDGTDYWLDGTQSGTRIETLDEVPRYHYALPIRDAGADLLALPERFQSTPDRIARITMDHSSGIRLPALIDVELEFRGQLAAPYQAVAEQGDAEIIEQTAQSAISGVVGEALLFDERIEYDAESGTARVFASGIQSSAWKRDRAVYRLEAPAQAAKQIGFDSDRARAAWRDIPLRLNGPLYFQSEFELLLPNETDEFDLVGSIDTTETIGGVELRSEATLAGGRFEMTQAMRSLLEELPAAEITNAKRSLTRFDRSLPVVKSPRSFRQLWQYFGDDRELLASHEAAYARAIEKAEEDNPVPLMNRARFRAGVYEYAGALEDIDAALAIEESRDLYLSRASVRQELGDLDGALEDYRLSEDLTPDGSTYYNQIQILSLLDRPDEAIALAEEYRGLADTEMAEDVLIAETFGWTGNRQAGLQLLEDQIASRPGDGYLLNQKCWFMGTWNMLGDDGLQTCIEAVEKSEYSAAALDSRALAHIRLGDFSSARADLDAALLAQPSMAGSRLLRGIVRIAQGEKDGRNEIELALKMQPSLAAVYRTWGLDF